MCYNPDEYNPNTDPDNVMWLDVPCAVCGNDVTVSADDDTDDALCYPCSEALHTLRCTRPRASVADLIERATLGAALADHYESAAARFAPGDPFAAVLTAAAHAGAIGSPAGDGACAEPVSPYVAPRFPLGRLCATPAALQRLSLAAVHPVQLLHRHVRGDWGGVGDDDARANDLALTSGQRLLSVYPVDGGPVWVLTEADRSLTTVLLPEDY